MDVSGVLLRQPPCFSSVAGVGISDAYSSCSSSRLSFCSVSVRGRGSRGRGVCLRPRKMEFAGYRDKGHLQYYNRQGLISCGEKKKDKDKDKDSTKKKLKLLKKLSKDLSVVSGIAVDANPDDGLVGEVQGKLIAEAAEVLLKQLQQLKEEEKEMKRKKKEEKARLKAARMKTMLDCESSTSDSSDSEREEKVIDVNQIRKEAVAVAVADAQPVASDSVQTNEKEAALISPTQKLDTTEINDFQDHRSVVHDGRCCGGPSTSCRSASTSIDDDMSGLGTGITSLKRIEVCLGNKCKKLGAATLLEEFERIMGLKGAVAGCKCMGKCRDGPNVRVLNSLGEGLDDFGRTPPNPLCVGVGLEDVGIIVANYFGEDEKNLGVAPAF